MYIPGLSLVLRKINSLEERAQPGGGAFELAIDVVRQFILAIIAARVHSAGISIHAAPA